MTGSASAADPGLPSPLAGPSRHRFLSPHYDDIALSCGGTVALFARAGLAPEIVVLFGDQPDPSLPLSPFAQNLHARWGLAAGEVIAARRREEAAAAAALGATSRGLPFLDAIYRGRHYQSDDQLFGPPASTEASLPASVASALALDTPPDPHLRLYAPLAVGGHVDHRHAFAVALGLARGGWDVLFYEDLPYALRPGALDARLAALPPGLLAPAATVDVTATWDAKLTAILAYPSQLAAVFALSGARSTPAEIDDVMRAHALAVGAGALSERLWRLAADPPPAPNPRLQKIAPAWGIDKPSTPC